MKVTEIFPSSNGDVRTVTVQKENGDEQTLTTDKLAIVKEDLLKRYNKCQGLQTVDHNDDGSSENDEERILATAGREGLRASLQCDMSGDRASSAHTTPSASNARASTEETVSVGHRRGRPPRCQEPQLAGRPDSLRAPLIDDDRGQCLS